MRVTAVLLVTVLGIALGNAAPSRAVEPWAGAQVSESLMNRHGLTRAWLAQVSLDASSSQLAHVSLFVDRTRSYTVHEISYGSRKEYISERDIDSSGALLGPEGAKKKLERRLLFLKGENPVVTEKTLPETLLVCVSNRGMVHVIDAETGRTRWARLVGNPRFDTLAPAVTENQIAIISGNNLHVVRTVDGLPLKTIVLKHVAAAGPAISEGWVYIPRVDGTMDWYPLLDQKKLPSWFRGIGRLEKPASVHPGYVTWMTDDGYFYALNAFTQKVQFEVQLVGKPVGPPVYAGESKVIVATQSGYVACIDLRTATILWRYSTGEPIFYQPLVVGDSVYAVNSSGTLTKLSLATGVDINTGDVSWTASGVRELLAAANGRIYAVNSLGSLIAIDSERGAIVDRIQLPRENLFFVFNPLTNRVLLGSPTGLVQSLRPTAGVYPEIFPGALETATNGEGMLGGKSRTSSEPSDAPPARRDAPSDDDSDPFKEPAPAKGGDPNDPFG